MSSATELAQRLARGSGTVRDELETCLANIARLDAESLVFRELCADSARARADELDAARARGEPQGPLFGVPFAIKSNMCLRGLGADCGSRVLEGYRPPYTATSVERLLEAGALVVGTTHMDEFAMGSSGENSAFASTPNPWDAERTPGGSSSGSAAAVALGLVPLALGSDTGGSVRQPAALCGVSGFKPSYGGISRYGLVAFASSLDQVSPLARDARDLQLALSVLSGDDPRDATCLPLGATLPTSFGDDLSGLRIGLPTEFFGDDVEVGVRARIDEALDVLRAAGAETQAIALPHARQAVATYYVVATAEASSNLARFDGVRYGLRKPGDGTLDGMYRATREAGFGAEVKRRILLGTYVLSGGYYEAWYDRAMRVRRLLHADFQRAFESVDLLLCPTSPTTAFRLGARTADPLAMYMSDVLTTPASLAGLPAASVPCGLAPAADDATRQLPVGLQIIGPAREDARVLALARRFQELTQHHEARP